MKICNRQSDELCDRSNYTEAESEIIRELENWQKGFDDWKPARPQCRVAAWREFSSS